jgi:hypothetical protein
MQGFKESSGILDFGPSEVFSEFHGVKLGNADFIKPQNTWKNFKEKKPTI